MTAVDIDSSKETKTNYILILALCLLALLGVRYYTLMNAGTDLFFDEAQYWAWSQNMDFGYFSKPPFLAWSIRAVTEVCGNSEFCIRAASPLFHTFTAIFLFLAGRALYGPLAGLWAAITFSTIPGISLSANLISTDVPLLTFWALALWAFIEFRKHGAWNWAILMGVAIGFGLLSKYAMAFFVMCLGLHILFTPSARWMLKSPKLWSSLGIGAIILSPNIIWNLQNGLVTFSHTADNANWKGVLVHPDKAAEFFAAQLGVFGPILFIVLLLAVLNLYRFRSTPEHKKALNADDSMLLTFSIPVILLITTQAFLSRAHANWAATAYPAATVLVTGLLIRYQSWLVLRISFVIHIVTMIFISLMITSAGKYIFPGGIDPMARVLGWKEIGEISEKKLQEQNYKALLTERRSFAAEMYYYLRDSKTPVRTWKAGSYPRDYFQMAIPLKNAKPEDKFLLVSPLKNPAHVLNSFENVEHFGRTTVPAGLEHKRIIYYFRISGYKGG